MPSLEWTPNPLLRGALTAAAAGLRVFPAHSPTAWPVPGLGDAALDCSCGEAGCPAPGAHPRWLDWQEVATTDAARLDAIWADSPAANPAVVTGELIDVLEVPAGAGEATASRLARLAEDFPVARAGSGSWQFYLRASGLPDITLRDDPDGGEGPSGRTLLHGLGGWVLVPPARHVDGGADPRADAGAADRPRVLLATMQHALRDAIQQLLSDEGIPVVGRVDSGSAAVTFVARERPDIVVMGLVLAGSLGAFDTVRLIKQAVEPTQIIVLVGVRSDTTARLAMDAGASIVLEEAGRPGLLIDAIAVLWKERRSGHPAVPAALP